MKVCICPILSEWPASIHWMSQKPRVEPYMTGQKKKEKKLKKNNKTKKQTKKLEINEMITYP